ncbi:MAG: hypothetical protein NPINA01_22350 [Nitrospinaceae bacterium]|nr:MAG: hypothetical protein NPINA01_22350 [Nitrospinaceae bacterium]
MTYWDFKRGMNTVFEGAGIYKDIFLFSTLLDPDGTPSKVNSETVNYPSALKRLKSSGFQPWLTIVNDVKSPQGNKAILKDPNLVHQILKEDESRRKHQQKIIDFAKTYEVTGVDIDYENLFPGDRLPFTRFISELAKDLKKQNLSLSVTVQPKTGRSSSQGKGAMDWSQICRHADRLQIMLYNLHNPKTQPGPVATLDWISSVLKYAKNQCDPKIIVPVLKVSGMHWSSRKNKAIQYDQAMDLKTRHGVKLERETVSKVPYFSYRTGTERGTVYFEDAHSLKIKIEHIKSLGFETIVFWSFGRQDPELTFQLKEFLKPVAKDGL